MQKYNDWENVTEQGGQRRNIPAGGYVCKIVSVTDEVQKQYLRIEYDIAQGDYKDYALETETRSGFWPLSSFRSYKEKAIGFFKRFISAVERSNKNYRWGWDEHTLEGKLVGVVIGEEEYYKQNGDIGVRTVASDFVSIYDIKDGKYSVPEMKRVQRKETTTTETAVDDGDLPFDFN